MQKPESVLENEIHKILWNFQLDTNRSSNPAHPHKRTCHQVDFIILADHRVKR